ncbi:uncharacterized protein TNCV_755431 [Trichonephila clavipes]|nr:uncharacterized protein TNCV_755431 [Trichonephila clavipes]
MITYFFIPELNNHDVQELWFQQDGATCHTARATIDLLKDTFGDRLISRFGPVNWPPRSCDLTPLDYFLWGYVKSLVYADKPQTLDYLEDNIRRVIADIRPQMLEKVIENWTSRLDYIRASRGSHMPEIIFKMSSRAHQMALARLRSGHLRSMTFVQGVKSFFTSPCSLLASPAHLLNCWGISLRQLYEEQDLVSRHQVAQQLHRSINHQVANMVAKNDVNLALSPTFRYVPIESSL